MTRPEDALESCLKLLEEGRTVDSALAGFPDLQATLRPMLEAAVIARREATTGRPTVEQRVGRARFLQRAAGLREAARPRRGRIIPALPRLAMSFSLLFVLVLTSTGLVSASSTALPGEQLYGIKRSWEDVRLLFVVQRQDRAQLQSEFEQERLDEIDDLLTRRQAATITFSGMVMKLQGGVWLVSGIPVSVSGLTTVPVGIIRLGDPVAITGNTRNDGVVEAQDVRLLKPGVSLPPLEPSDHEAESQPEGLKPAPDGSAPGSVQAGFPTASAADRQRSYEFTGVVESMGPGAWRINGQTVYLDPAAAIGSVSIGTLVRFEGYYGEDDRFVATRIEPDMSPTGTSGTDGNDSGSSPGGSGSDDGTQPPSSDDRPGDH